MRSNNSEEQRVEILERFKLHSVIAPFQRCLRCNGELILVDKAAIHNQIPYYNRLYYDKFTQCQKCHQIYWQGARYERIQSLIALAKVQAVTPAIEEEK